jgi:glutathione peroxidase
MIQMPTFAKSIYDFTLESAKGDKIELSKYKDKFLVITNIATECGYTPQLKPLNDLNKKKEVVVIGIPSNEFGGQSPGTEKEIVEFCEKNYGVKFQMSKKMKVLGNEKIELIKTLQDKTDKAEIAWNFEKYIVFPKEKKILHFKSSEFSKYEEMEKLLK